MSYFKRGALIESMTITASSGSTYVLTKSSLKFHQITGSAYQTVQMPDATLLANDTGLAYTIQNRTTTILLVRTNGHNFICNIAPNAERVIQLTNGSTSDGVWDVSTSASGIDGPLRAYASFPPDSKLNFSANAVFAGDGSELRTPPQSSSVFNVVASTVDFQSGATTGATFTGFSLPTATIGQYVRCGFSLLTNGTIQAIFTAPNATLVGTGDPGATFAVGALPITYVDLIATGTNAYATVNSASAIIEAAPTGVAAIHRFGSGGGGAGGGLPTFVAENPAYNGSGGAYTTSQKPTSASSTLVFVDDLLVEYSIAYTLDISTGIITFQSGYIPDPASQSVYTVYISGISSVAATQETPSPAPDGLTTIFTLSGVAASKAGTIVTIDGRVINGNQWNLIQVWNASQIEFTGFTPAPGTEIYVFYIQAIAGAGASGAITNVENLTGVGGDIGLVDNITAGIAYLKELAPGVGVALTIDIRGNVVISAPGTAGGYVVTQGSSSGSPFIVNPAVSIPVTSDPRQFLYIKSAGGVVTMSANPQIAAGISDGQEITFMGVDSSNYLQLKNNTSLGILSNGDVNLTNGQTISYVWDLGNLYWREQFRR